MEAADLTDLLKQGGDFTLFAPSDKAFASLSQSDLAMLKSTSLDLLQTLIVVQKYRKYSLSLHTMLQGTSTHFEPSSSITSTTASSLAAVWRLVWQTFWSLTKEVTLEWWMWVGCGKDKLWFKKKKKNLKFNDTILTLLLLYVFSFFLFKIVWFFFSNCTRLFGLWTQLPCC